jgi:hypothetical protein
LIDHLRRLPFPEEKKSKLDEIYPRIVELEDDEYTGDKRAETEDSEGLYHIVCVAPRRGVCDITRALNPKVSVEFLLFFRAHLFPVPKPITDVLSCQ